MELGLYTKVPHIDIKLNGNTAKVSYNELKLRVDQMEFRVRRRGRDFDNELLQSLEGKSLTASAVTSVKKTPYSVTVCLSGFAEDHEKARQLLADYHTNKTTTISINPPHKISENEIQEMQAVVDSYSVRVTYTEANGIVLKGLDTVIQQARADVQDYLLQRSKGESFHPVYPTTWEPQTSPSELKPVESGGSEWKTIEKRLLETLPNGKIYRIDRIQNKPMWEKYTTLKKWLEKKNNGSANEKNLFHGTSNNPPSLIFKDEVGFDMRYSEGGMWGIAIYFAENASYSDSYAYTTTSM